MKKLERINFIGHVFMYGAKAQLKEEWTINAAVVIGLQQGLKYGGSLKRGLTGGIATLLAILAGNGLYNVVSFWDKIKKL